MSDEELKPKLVLEVNYDKKKWKWVSMRIVYIAPELVQLLIVRTSVYFIQDENRTDSAAGLIAKNGAHLPYDGRLVKDVLFWNKDNIKEALANIKTFLKEINGKASKFK